MKSTSTLPWYTGCRGLAECQDGPWRTVDEELGGSGSTGSNFTHVSLQVHLSNVDYIPNLYHPLSSWNGIAAHICL